MSRVIEPDNVVVPPAGVECGPLMRRSATAGLSDGTVNLSNPRVIFAGSPPRFTRSRVTYEYAVSRTSTRPQVDSAPAPIPLSPSQVDSARSPDRCCAKARMRAGSPSSPATSRPRRPSWQRHRTRRRPFRGISWRRQFLPGPGARGKTWAALPAARSGGVGTGSKAARLLDVRAEPGHGGRLVAVDEPVFRRIMSATTRIDDALPVASQHLVGDRTGLDRWRVAERRDRRRDTVQPVGATLLTRMAPSGRASTRGRAGGEASPG
jgi:hypothetical protein